jgi:hypothetical protein
MIISASLEKLLSLAISGSIGQLAYNGPRLETGGGSFKEIELSRLS